MMLLKIEPDLKPNSKTPKTIWLGTKKEELILPEKLKSSLITNVTVTNSLLDH
jgi:hypothetical protein